MIPLLIFHSKSIVFEINSWAKAHDSQFSFFSVYLLSKIRRGLYKCAGHIVPGIGTFLCKL